MELDFYKVYDLQLITEDTGFIVEKVYIYIIVFNFLLESLLLNLTLFCVSV